VTNPDVAHRLAGLPAHEQAAVAELLHGGMRKHTLFATRASYEPVRLQPEGLAVLALYPKRSPLFDWQCTETRGKKHGKHVVVRQYAFDVPVRSVELNAWQARVVDRCDGGSTAFEVFEQPDIYTSVPGLTAEEKLQAYGRFMELMAAQGALLFCM
jgi:hypothetical protein